MKLSDLQETSASDEPPVGVRVLDLHLPIFAVERKADKSLEATSPAVYGTTFPILPGVFVTAGHVITDASADGIPAIGRMAPDGGVRISQITDHEVFTPLDLALLICPGLEELTPMPLEFDHRLAFYDPAYSLGFPCGVDPEWVTLVPRGFRGYVVTRRELYQLPGQPPGYEVSFAAPRGLSGAPLVSHRRNGEQYCYGYMVQQSTIGTGDEQTALGVAVDVSVLLTITTHLKGIGTLATALGRDPIDMRSPSPVQLPGGVKPSNVSVDDWPDDDDTPSEEPGE